jgi:hypothetical protein
MKNLLEVTNIMFKDRKDWNKVTDDEKSAYFFIINRYFSKKYPYLAQTLNLKETDKSIGMDLIFNFMMNQPYPKWLWSKSEKKVEKGFISEKDELKLLERWNIKKEELELLIRYYPEEIKEELDYINQSEKGKK